MTRGGRVLPTARRAIMAQAAEQSPASASSLPMINLMRGWPHPPLLPAAALRAAADRVLGTPDLAVPSLLYGPDPGYQPLRQQLATYLHGTFAVYGAPNDPERLCITGGASQNVACLLQSFTDPAYTHGIWLVAPVYHLVSAVFEDSGFADRLHGVPEDDEGIDVATLEQMWAKDSAGPETPVYKTNLQPTHRRAFRRVVYVVPASSNPSGRTMSQPRREALVRLARRYDALVICDDVYDFLQWPVGVADQDRVDLPAPLPRLVDIDRLLPHDEVDAVSPFGNVVSNGSFSKMVGPGMRTGWAEGTPALAFGLAQTASTKSGGAPSQLCASIIAELLRSGALENHLAAVVRPALQRRHRLLMAAIQAHLGGLATVESDRDGTFGGYFVWLRLHRDDLDAEAVAQRAMATAGLVVAPGTIFAVRGDDASARFRHHIRLCFAWEDEQRLTEGVARLGQLLRTWDSVAEAAGSIDTQAIMDNFK